MKTPLLLLFIFGIIFSGVAQDRADQIRDKLLQRDEGSVLVVAHRGDWRNFPENSIAAINNAIKMGVDIVEIDIQRTKDGHLILMHDKSINRTTTGKGLVADLTIDSIRRVKLKSGCAIPTKHKVPTLEEALQYSKGKIMLNLDKADRFFDEIFPLLEKTGTANWIIMKGHKSAQEVKSVYGKYLKSVIYMPIVNLDNPDALMQINTFIKEFNPVAFELLYQHDANPLPGKIKTLLSGKHLIWYNTLWDNIAGGHDDDMALENPHNAYGYLIKELGARIIQTDRPAYLIEYLRAMNQHS